MDDLLSQIAGWLGMSPSLLVLLLGLLYGVANFLTRAIPDNATGWQGFVRTVCSWIALYQSSKIAPGVTIQAATRASLGLATVRNGVKAQIDDPALADKAESVMKEIASDLPTGLFKKNPSDSSQLNSPLITTMLALAILIALSGCAGTLAQTCSHASTIRQAAEAFEQSCRSAKLDANGIY
jgi:hypothetical protein